MDVVERGGLRVDGELARFIDGDVLAPLGRDVETFWQGFASLLNAFVPRNRALLATRDALQAQIDAWHAERAGKPLDPAEYRAFLTEIGYLVPEPGAFTIGTTNVDPEIATMAGPQLVVPALNARFLLNAANARWGSLYDAFYGTDALDAPPAQGRGYDEMRGEAVIAAGRAFLDRAAPLASASWADLSGPDAIILADPAQFFGQTDKSRLFVHHGLHIEVVFDREHPIGAKDKAGIADIVLEAALTTIVDIRCVVLHWDAY